MAYYLNRAQIIGNLTREPESRQLPSGQSVCNFSVATNRSYTDKEGNQRDDVEFHNCVAWGKLAEICQQYLGKGRKVFLEGRLQTRSWEGQDGVKRSRTEINIEQMIMLDRAGGNAQNSSANNNQQFGQSQPQFGQKPQGQNPVVAQPDTELPTISLDDPMGGDSQEIRIEDIPF